MKVPTLRYGYDAVKDDFIKKIALAVLWNATERDGNGCKTVHLKHAITAHGERISSLSCASVCGEVSFYFNGDSRLNGGMLGIDELYGIYLSLSNMFKD